MRIFAKVSLARVAFGRLATLDAIVAIVRAMPPFRRWRCAKKWKARQAILTLSAAIISAISRNESG